MLRSGHIALLFYSQNILRYCYESQIVFSWFVNSHDCIKQKTTLFPIILIILIQSSDSHASELNLYYSNFKLSDIETNEEAQGIHTAGLSGNFFNIIYFNYEVPEGKHQVGLDPYIGNPSDREAYKQAINLGLRFLYFLDDSLLKGLYAEYSKDEYQTGNDTFATYYTQKMVFVGYGADRWDEAYIRYGLFYHESERQRVLFEKNHYERTRLKSVYGLLLQMNNLLMPYENGSPVDGKKYGTGILVDDLKVQNQLAGGDDYFFSVGLGVGGRQPSYKWYAKYVMEITTVTAVGKVVAGVNYRF